MARITVEDCIDKFPSRFELVLVASQRARKLYSGENPTVEKDNDKNTVIALREIAESTISVEAMKENVIQEYQTITISDEEEENLEIETSEKINDNLENSMQDDQTEEEIKDLASTEIKDLASAEIEEEISNLTSSEDSEIEEQYEITEDIDKDVSDSEKQVNNETEE